MAGMVGIDGSSPDRQAMEGQDVPRPAREAGMRKGDTEATGSADGCEHAGPGFKSHKEEAFAERVEVLVLLAWWLSVYVSFFGPD